MCPALKVTITKGLWGRKKKKKPKSKMGKLIGNSKKRM